MSIKNEAKPPEHQEKRKSGVRPSTPWGVRSVCINPQCKCIALLEWLGEWWVDRSREEAKSRNTSVGSNVKTTVNKVVNCCYFLKRLDLCMKNLNSRLQKHLHEVEIGFSTLVEKTF